MCPQAIPFLPKPLPFQMTPDFLSAAAEALFLSTPEPTCVPEPKHKLEFFLNRVQPREVSADSRDGFMDVLDRFSDILCENNIRCIPKIECLLLPSTQKMYVSIDVDTDDKWKSTTKQVLGLWCQMLLIAKKMASKCKRFINTMESLTLILEHHTTGHAICYSPSEIKEIVSNN
jgi:hypothetical protein